MKPILSISLIALAILLKSSNFVRPVLIIHADTMPFKWKPEKVWTKSIPNKKFGEFCIYDTSRFSDGVDEIKDRLDSSNLFITG